MVTLIEVVVFCFSWWCRWENRNRQAFFRKEAGILEDKKNAGEPKVKIRKTKKRLEENFGLGRHKWIRFSLLLPTQKSFKKKISQP
jgi:type VI protein secretion system component VasK